jgi:hypothetical protein
VLIRPATDADWPAIWPFFSQIVEAGDTYAYPEDTTSDEARALWMEGPPGHVVVAIDDSDAEGEPVLGLAKIAGRIACLASADRPIRSRYGCSRGLCAVASALRRE